MGNFDQFAGDEAGHEPVSSPIWRIVVNEKVVGMSSSRREALHGLFVRLGNRVQRH